MTELVGYLEQMGKYLNAFFEKLDMKEMDMDHVVEAGRPKDEL